MITTQIAMLTEPEMADFLDAVQRERGDTEWARLAGFMGDVRDGERTIWMAQHGGQNIDMFVGMISVRWQSDYAGFRKTPMAPEIVDLYVWQDFRRQGVAGALLEHVEQAVQAKRFQRIGLSVGVLQADAAGWPLYLWRGYRFDGTGAWWQGARVTEQSVVDLAQGPLMLMLDKML